MGCRKFTDPEGMYMQTTFNSRSSETSNWHSVAIRRSAKYYNSCRDLCKVWGWDVSGTVTLRCASNVDRMK